MQVLSWSGFFADQFGINGLGSTKWVIFDPATDTATGEMTSMTDHDMFCPSISMLPDGRIVVGGGNNAEATSIYTDDVGWEATSQMNIPRGYSSAITLSNGQVRLFQLLAQCANAESLPVVLYSPTKQKFNSCWALQL